jgi:hypothetical protein
VRPNFVNSTRHNCLVFPLSAAARSLRPSGGVCLSPHQGERSATNGSRRPSGRGYRFDAAADARRVIAKATDRASATAGADESFATHAITYPGPVRQLHSGTAALAQRRRPPIANRAERLDGRASAGIPGDVRTGCALPGPGRQWPGSRLVLRRRDCVTIGPPSKRGGVFTNTQPERAPRTALGAGQACRPVPRPRPRVRRNAAPYDQLRSPAAAIGPGEASHVALRDRRDLRA